MSDLDVLRAYYDESLPPDLLTTLPAATPRRRTRKVAASTTESPDPVPAPDPDSPPEPPEDLPPPEPDVPEGA